MSDDLIARLRDIRHHPVCGEAADAIEALNARIDELDEKLIGAVTDAEAGWSWAFAFDKLTGHMASTGLPEDEKDRFHLELDIHEGFDV